MENHKTTQFISSLVIVLLLQSACTPPFKCEDDNPNDIDPGIKIAVQGVFNHHHWLLVNNYGDSLEIKCEDYENGYNDYLSSDCEFSEFMAWSDCTLRMIVNGVLDFNTFNVFWNSTYAFYIQNPTQSNGISALPRNWVFEWLPNEHRMDNSVKMESGDTVLIENFVDHNGVKHEGVFLSFNKFNQSYFVISPEIGLLGFFYSEDSNETTALQDTLRLAIYH